MNSEEAYDVIEHSNPEMGTNYLIADGVVYSVTMWAMGGVCDRQTWKPGDPNYETFYRSAVHNPHTLFKERTK
jgi:hypothetical protein